MSMVDTMYFCLRCFSRNVYVRIKSHEIVCRKCGTIISISKFNSVYDDYLIKAKKAEKNVLSYGKESKGRY